MRLRIDELAARTGVTTRNIRAYQARGLLPPPQLEARTGYYGEEHVQRLELISELQQRGFSLEAIRHVLDAWASGGNLTQLLGFRHLLDAPFTDEQPATVPLDDLLDRFPDARENPALVERAARLGVIEQRDGGVVVAPSPVLIEAGTELTRIGVGLDAILDLVEALREDSRRIADRFIDLVMRSVLELIEEGAQETDLQELIDTLGRLRPLAMEVLRPFMAAALRESIDDAQARLAADDDADVDHRAS